MSTPGQLEAAILAAANTVIDPCSEVAGTPAGLVDMGLVAHVDLQPCAGGGYEAHLRFGVTEPGCWMVLSFLPKLHAAIQNVPGVVSAKVSVDSDFVWSPERMSAALRQRVQRHREPAAPGWAPVRWVR